ncbi:ferredoxin:thioredoxin reductase [Candidatus Fermentibacteria bacterium]|nr:ferredoxin:thioredoxin reductase [Candidatus Fermentibacteria bacterium]
MDTYQEVLKKHAASRGLTMNPDETTVQPLLEGLLANGMRHGLRTCPCRPAVGTVEADRDIVCPCVYAEADVEEYGACYCWLFVSEGWVDGTVPRRRVPERRPPEKTLGL